MSKGLWVVRHLIRFITSTECAYVLSLEWKEFEESRVRLEAEKVALEKCRAPSEKEKDMALACSNELVGKYQDLQSIRDRLLKSKSDLAHLHEVDIAVLKSSLREFE
ncbi:hypothetical protein LIER_05924 [Lithospermum erythrorhizon]|uniref:Uncharacterized protein n=1 Tax=Lithospermum erythrorhizon TaxID=34254 RepID=A0AAV3P2M0_LITER